MKAVIISTSDIKGGAAVVASRLLDAFPHVGVEATMLALNKSGHSARTLQYGSHVVAKADFLAERAQIFLANGFSRKNLFKVSTASFGLNPCNHPAVRDADVIIINWINQGALSLNAIDRICSLGKPVIWIMHDMWQATGICHHALGCPNFISPGECGNCPLLQSQNPKDLSHTILLRKRELYELSNLHFVAVSNWLARECRRSTLLRNAPVSVIPNAFPIEDFSHERRCSIDGVPQGKTVMVMGAARLDDPIKGFPTLIKVTEHLAARGCADSHHLLLFGSIRDASLLGKLAIPYTHLGTLNTAEQISEVYANADIVLSTSEFETLPGTLIEGAAAGCVPVSFGNSGQTDIIRHLETGYLAEYHNPASIADGILWATQNPLPRKELHDNISALFSAREVAMRYKILMESMLNDIKPEKSEICNQ